MDFNDKFKNLVNNSAKIEGVRCENYMKNN